MLFSTAQCLRASRMRSGLSSAVMISSGRPVVPSARIEPSKLTIMPSPMESKSPSEPHMHIGGRHQVLEAVGLVGEAPGGADRRCVARCTDHDFGALVGAFARHLGKHSVMADDERELRAFRAITDGDADVARFPRLDRRPGMHLAIVELERSVSSMIMPEL